MKIRILLVDDHKMFREGVRNMLSHQDDMEVVGEAGDGRMAADLVRKLSPRAIIMDVSMPNLNGIDATRRILKASPNVKVIALSMHAHPHLVQEMLEAGASGYVLKECAFEELAHAVRLAVAKDQVYLSPEASRVLVDDYLQIVRRDKTPGIPLLTSREREILQLVAEGKTSTQIAHTLCMSKRTVEKHRLHIMGKLKIPNLVELIKYAIREGLTEL